MTLADLEQKSKELKSLVSKYETSTFLGSLSIVLNFTPSKNKLEFLKGLSSPYRQLHYLAGLNLTSSVDDSKPLLHSHTDEEWKQITDLLQEIEFGYMDFFNPNRVDTTDPSWKQKLMVSMPSFLSYFNQGDLNYEEQIIERIQTYFKPFEKLIINAYGLSIEDFVNIYNYIDSIPNKYLDEKLNKHKGGTTWKDFTKDMIEKQIPPEKWMEHMPQGYKNLFEFLQDEGAAYRFTEQDLSNQFGKDKATQFLKALTCMRQEDDFLYYTQKNPIYVKPIFRVGIDSYQVLEMKQIIHSIYNLLFEFCKTLPDNGDKFYKIRGNELENKIMNLFQHFFKGKAHSYKGYYTQDGHEQDLLFLIDGLALIIEAKASKRNEPKREPDKSYPMIEANFKETIQKGYDQAFRVKSKFINQEILKIYRDSELKDHIIDIRTKNYQNAFSIIVTLEHFGTIQTDLSALLKKEPNDAYPWSVNIDNLEVLLLFLKKKGLTTSTLRQFLILRERLHSHLICGDELEVCGGFLAKKITRDIIKSDSVIMTAPDLAGIFDDMYTYNVLGFKNEKNIDRKKKGGYVVLGDTRHEKSN